MHKFVRSLGIALVLLCSSTIAYASSSCGDDVKHIIKNKNLPYKQLYLELTAGDNIENITVLVNILESTSTTTSYDNLLQAAYDIVNAVNGSVVLTPVTEPDIGNALKVVSPRIMITESDGTVIVDTAAWTGTGPYFRKSTLANWQSKTVNENHNTRVAILDCQIFPCGYGAESKFSSSVLAVQNYVAHRLKGLDNSDNSYLRSAGTIRLSQNQ